MSDEQHHPAHHRHSASAHHPFAPEHWEERYGGDQVWSGAPNQALVAEVADLPAGSVLDVGCGEGADSVWLAGQGWTVTALDISRNAVDRALRAADEAGVEVTGVVGSALEVELEGAFDLVSAMYPVLPRTADRASERRLMDLVAPGGTLLFVHHEVDHEHAQAHGFDPEEFVGTEQMAAALTAEWDVVTEVRRERHVTSGAGAGHTHDLILRARRRHPATGSQR